VIPRELRVLARGLGVSTLGPETLVPVACTCYPPRRHGPHLVPARRLRRDGDLRGRVVVSRDVLADIDAAVDAAGGAA
jgi:hypothetical protein